MTSSLIRQGRQMGNDRTVGNLIARRIVHAAIEYHNQQKISIRESIEHVMKLETTWQGYEYLI